MTESDSVTDGARRLAVVTGASSGIGFELARVFGENGFDLIVAAEDGELDRAASELSAVAPRVESVKVDLATPEGVETIYSRIRRTERPVDALALNAGIGAGGEFARETDLDQELRLIDLNVRSTVHLCKLVLADTEVTVTALLPGPTETGFFERAEIEDTKVGGSLKNKAQVLASRALPDSAKAEMHRKMAEPGSAEKR